MNKNVLHILVFVILLLFIYPDRVQSQPEITSEAALLMDMENEQILFQKNADKRMYPASTTKILTALIVIKNGNLEDRVQVSREAATVGGSHVGLQEGEILKLEDLLYILLLASGNDAAVALAEHIGGSVENFASMMNSEARAIGALSSNFTNPHGLHHPEHYSTAGDLSLIALEAMKNPIFRKIAGTYHFSNERQLPQPVKGIPQTDFVNHNKLMRPGYSLRYEGTTGIKTGYTDEAGQCLVASAGREGRELLTVVLKSGSSGVYQDTVSLFNYGFNEFTPVVLAEAGTEAGKSPVKRGQSEEIIVVTGGKFYYNIPVGDDVGIEKEININKNITAPVSKGQKVGSISFKREGKVIGSVNLVSDRDVDRKPLFRWWYGLIVLMLLFLLTRIQARRRRKRYLLRKKRWY